MPAATYNEALYDALVRHQIGLLRYSASVRRRIFELLDATERDIRIEIASRLRTQVGPLRLESLRRMEAVLDRLRETRLAAWSRVDEYWLGEMRRFALAEPAFVDGILRTAIPVRLGTRVPQASRLREIVSARPFEGRTMREWARKLRRDDLERIEGSVRVGMVQGEAPVVIARRVVGTAALRGRNGVTQVTRRNAEAVARTAVNFVGSEARREYFAENADLIRFEVFVATLDERTTPICASLDGERFPVGEGATPPLHYNCRSLRVAVIDGAAVAERPTRDFTQRGLLREFAADEGFRAPTTRARLPHGTRGRFDAFARRRMRELTGTTPDRTTYQAWLGRQSAAFQDDVLGKTKGALFRRGDLPLSKFVDQTGRELTLAELARFEADAFRAAGLDPEDFL